MLEHSADEMPAESFNINCPEVGTHMFAHVRKNQYYMCVEGVGAILTCAKGLYFDSETNACREFKNIVAWKD